MLRRHQGLRFGIRKPFSNGAALVVRSVQTHVSFRRAPGFRLADKEIIARGDGSSLSDFDVPAFVLPNFLSVEEETALLTFSDPLFEPLPFAHGHYDGLIEHYKEFYRPWRALGNASALSGAPPQSDPAVVSVMQAALTRARREAQSFLPFTPLQDRVHFLQLEGRGFIRAHADEQRNSSGIVAGITLRSGRVMMLTHPRYPDVAVELLLSPRSMYILAASARDEWLHSVDWAKDQEPPQDGTPVFFDTEDTGMIRSTRTAIIFRGLSPMELFLERMNRKSE